MLVSRLAIASILASAVGDVFGRLTSVIESLSASPSFYAVIFAVAGLDSVVPIVPGETTVILGGISAGQGTLSLGAVIAAGAIGAMTGDSVAYAVGRFGGAALQRRVIRGDKGQARLAWAERQLAIRGGLLLITARFIPGGRTMVTIASGVTGQPYRRFVLFDGVACVVWASYAGGLGYFFGERFAENHTLAFVLAFTTAIGVSLLVEFARWGRKRSRGSANPDGEGDSGM